MYDIIFLNYARLAGRKPRRELTNFAAAQTFIEQG